MESRQKGLSRKNNAPERRIDRKRENFSRFWLGATGSATHTLSFWRLKRSITLEYNSQLLPFPDTSLDVNLGTFPLSRIPVRTNLCLSLCRGPSCLVTSHQRYSPLALAFNLLATKVQGVRRQTQLCNRPWPLWNLPLRAHEKENDNLQQQRQQKATQTLVVQNMDSTIHSGLNHYPEDKYYGNQLHYPVNRDLSGGLSAIHLELENLFPR